MCTTNEQIGHEITIDWVASVVNNSIRSTVCVSMKFQSTSVRTN